MFWLCNLCIVYEYKPEKMLLTIINVPSVFAIACVASVSVGLERNWGESQNKKEGVGKGKEGNACNQTPGF